MSTADHTGIVTEFDAARGWGAVTGDDGARAEFHCTQIADGSRSIPVGTAVRYRLEPGHLGRWEASAIEPV
jgi:cold shock CspA family protein